MEGGRSSSHFFLLQNVDNKLRRSSGRRRKEREHQYLWVAHDAFNSAFLRSRPSFLGGFPVMMEGIWYENSFFLSKVHTMQGENRAIGVPRSITENDISIFTAAVYPLSFLTRTISPILK